MTKQIFYSPPQLAGKNSNLVFENIYKYLYETSEKLNLAFADLNVNFDDIQVKMLDLEDANQQNVGQINRIASLFKPIDRQIPAGGQYYDYNAGEWLNEFPVNPSVGDIYIYDGVMYRYCMADRSKSYINKTPEERFKEIEADETPGWGCTANYTITMDGSSNTDQEIFNIESKIAGQPVLYADHAFFKDNTVVAVTFNRTPASIFEAFCYDENIRTVKYKGSINKINAKHAFQESGITKAIFPVADTIIADYMFTDSKVENLPTIPRGLKAENTQQSATAIFSGTKVLNKKTIGDICGGRAPSGTNSRIYLYALLDTIGINDVPLIDLSYIDDNYFYETPPVLTGVIGSAPRVYNDVRDDYIVRIRCPKSFLPRASTLWNDSNLTYIMPPIRVLWDYDWTYGWNMTAEELQAVADQEADW